MRHVEALGDLIWRFHKALKTYRRNPDPRTAWASDPLRSDFFHPHRLRRSRQTAVRLRRGKIELRRFVIKRKISGGIARDAFAGLPQTCQKIGLPFWHYLGDQLGIGNQGPVPPLATRVAARW